ncbi:GlsB/YeaQ/YmgE family stress response membrane protein [Acetivibrio cellulolyticus]|uniref:GlsB/YeaQ/YmgE family stress response membrane protein n=1 Tax=Acetivibrio cellulolyticus TaxID=35830 RepID=UPI0001E2F627|nr:GlsB/YeaQ/YmgE family stress response membrane protein [Acetivibrio cellulolyticus]
MVGFIVTVIIALVLGGIMNSILIGKIKGGAGEAAIAGLVGAWIGAYMPFFNTFGPKFFDIAIVPAILGGVVTILILSFFSSIAQKSS